MYIVLDPIYDLSCNVYAWISPQYSFEAKKKLHSREAIFQLYPPMASLSRSFYDMPGLSPRMYVLFWGRRDFQISFSIRDTSRNACNRHWGSVISVKLNSIVITFKEDILLSFHESNHPSLLYTSLKMTFFLRMRPLELHYLLILILNLPYTCSPKIYILLKRSLESVVHISLYNRLQTPADSERINRSSLNFQRMFPTLPSTNSVETNSFGVTKL